VGVVAVAILAARRPGDAAPVAMLVVGAAAIVAPVGRTERASWPVWFAVTAVGLGAFVVARVAWTALPAPATAWGVAATVAAGVAEEGVFRRLLYDRLSGPGPVVAVLGCAALFALVHVPAYGVASVPVNLAAGVVLGWQRWASGDWRSPAVTHAVANLIQLI
jgi:membrane protease YdiL (CAAX protease family)